MKYKYELFYWYHDLTKFLNKNQIEKHRIVQIFSIDDKIMLVYIDDDEYEKMVEKLERLG